jgi:hypothetical protein
MEAKAFKPRVGPAGIHVPEDPNAKQHEVVDTERLQHFLRS